MNLRMAASDLGFFIFPDWDVLQLVLQELPHVVQNKSLILGKHRNSEIDLLVDALCGMVRLTFFCCFEQFWSL